MKVVAILIGFFFLLFFALIILAIFSDNRVDEEDEYKPIVPKEDFID